MAFCLTMTTYSFENVLGKFNFTPKFRFSKKKGRIIIDKINICSYKEVLHSFKKKDFFNGFACANLLITAKDLDASADNDYFIRETVKQLDNLYKAKNPIKDKKLCVDLEEAIFEKESYLERLMEKHCPNLFAVADFYTASHLLKIAGSLKKLSQMAARKIQILGAESAFFKFLTSPERKSPKYGVIFHHQLVQGSSNKGRTARLLADKIAIAAKVDFFKGQFIGDKLRRELNEKVV